MRAALGTRAENHHLVGVEADDDLLRMDVDAIDAAIAERPKAKNVYIWGTRVEVTQMQKAFTDLLLTYMPAAIDEDETTVAAEDGRRVFLDREQPYYAQRLDEINISEEPILNLNLQHVLAHSEWLYQLIVAYPSVCCVKTTQVLVCILFCSLGCDSSS